MDPPPVHVVLLLLGVLSAVGHAEVTIYNIDRPTGSSVLLPGLESGMVEFSEDMIHELQKIGGAPEWVAQYHGGPVVHSAYASRGRFFQGNKSFLLENLRKEDSGVYEQKVNRTTLIRVFLSVIDPVPQPTLSRQDTGSCLIHLRCLASGEDDYNVTFLKDGKQMDGNITKNSEFSILLLDDANPQHWGTYTCNISNLISWKVSKGLPVEPQGTQEEEIPFYIAVAGLGTYAVYLIMQVLWRIKQLNDYKTLKDVLFMARSVCGVVLECAAFFMLGYYGYLFGDEWRSLIGGILLFMVVLLVRISWCFLINFNGSPMGWIITAEEVLLVTDVLLAPGLFTAELVLINHDGELCGMKMQTRWRSYFYLWIAMGAILLAVCLSRPCRGTHLEPLAQGSQKVPLDEITENNEGAGENSQEGSNNDLSMTDANSRESEEEEDGEGRVTGCPDMAEEEEDGEGRVTGCPDMTEEEEDGEGRVTGCPDMTEKEEDGEGRVTDCPDMTKEEEDGEGRVTDCPDMAEEEDFIQDTGRHNGCQDNMEDRADNERVTDENLVEDERSEEGIPLQAETCIE